MGEDRGGTGEKGGKGAKYEKENRRNIKRKTREKFKFLVFSLLAYLIEYDWELIK